MKILFFVCFLTFDAATAVLCPTGVNSVCNYKSSQGCPADTPCYIYGFQDSQAQGQPQLACCPYSNEAEPSVFSSQSVYGVQVLNPRQRNQAQVTYGTYLYPQNSAPAFTNYVNRMQLHGVGSPVSGQLNMVDAQQTSFYTNVARKQIAQYPILIYGKSTCNFCKQSKDFLSTRYPQAKFWALDYDTQPGGLMLVKGAKQISGMNTVPQIFICGTVIRGYDDLVNRDKAGTLAPLINYAVNNCRGTFRG